MYVILIGAPGAGKGTQAALLVEALGLPHVASGDLFRENLQNETPLGVQAKSYMDRGELVPDDVTIAMVRERLSRPDCEAGVILDGFPRTVAQAIALDKMLAEEGKAIDLVPYIRVSEETLVARLAGRWICGQCQTPYHPLANPPRQARMCDECGGQLYQRDDDKPETVRKRLEVYFAQTMPVIEHYRQQGLLIEVEGEGSIEEVQAGLLKAIQGPST